MLRIQALAKSDFPQTPPDFAVVVPLFQDGILEALTSPEAELLRPLVDAQVVRAKCEEVYFLPTPGGSQQGVLALGLGKREAFNAEVMRRCAGKACSILRQNRVKRIAIDLSSNEALPVDAFVEGLVLAQYRFDKYRQNGNDNGGDRIDVEELSLLLRTADRAENVQRSCERAALWSDSTNWARDLGNTAANELTPAALADAAKAMAKETGATCEILDEAHLERLGMNALLGVAKGSEQRAVMIVLKYQHPDAAKTLAIVGKGVTFDTGGISIKPAASMHEMKFDMCGAAATLAAFRTVCQLKPAVNVIAVVPSVENMPSGNAQKPGDIVKSYSGKTIEVDNTDAEGRLILCDALAYTVAEYKPDRIVDLATLTGGVVIALGHYCAGLMTNNEALAAALQRASDESGERVWRLPLWEDYEKLIKGTHADLKNIGPAREASSILGGCFLKQFVGDTAWAHFDIAGTAYGVKKISYLSADHATGYGVRLLARWILNEAENSAKSNGGSNR